ncbi:glycosyltransferase, group 1 family [Fibrobacter succinogenes subsp. succinogenes S85]|uniref:Glycosyl transferase group 1 n=1 Tax=Fibrobacter succinogenes (strain ATCC 19169 / S85) TaxID=59374 RepID=C9RMK4_FIBSS|nr:glycosyltransferase [Fibrobacter succinogenes]ACX76236.1 glycosyl transferase group 1 [Fibrobacter succinogenes subsp. succinogenes S85]ADL25149.1 glycosyltransferase, group 1 family [Fibrobacter succinogenes subsp. succinogenes S85]
MKVLHVVNTNCFSGAENVVCQIIDVFRNDMNMAYCGLEGPIRQALEKRNIKFFPIKKMSVSCLKKVIKEFKPDVVHSHDMRASFFTSLACGTIPLVCHIHNNAFDSRAISLKSVLFLLAALKAKHIFWVSDSSFAGYFFHQLFKNKSSILLNVINVESLIKKKNEDSCEYDYDVVFVGRLTYQKNTERLIEVLHRLVEKCPNVKCGIVGGGELANDTSDLIREKLLDKNVFMLGFKANPLKILSDSKVMLMTSRWEGLPMCALEALALGVPVVSTPVDGLLSIINQGENGFLSDNNEELVAFLTQIVNDDSFREKMSRKCVELSGEYNDLCEYRRNLKSVYDNACC